MTDFIDGIFLRYTFSAEATNILYEGLPSYNVILGQLLAGLFAICFLWKGIFLKKTRMGLTNSTTIGLYKEIWSKGVKGRMEVLFLLVFSIYLLFSSTFSLYRTVQLYQEFSKPVHEVMYGEMREFSIQKGSSKSSYAYVDAVFEDESGNHYHIHFVNMNKRMANKIEDGYSYDAELNIGKDGKVLYSNDFLDAK